MAPRFYRFSRSTFAQATCGAVLLWAALPPVNLWPLAWVAPVWWILLARRDELPGRRPYRALWLVGFLFWLATYHFIRLPHPATSIGWVALAAYLGCYLPVFVGLTRVAVHRARVPVILAAPVVWTGLELARAHLITGITMGALGHTQYRWLALIQVSDLAGGYAVDFTIMFVAAGVARMISCGPSRRWTWWPVATAVALLAIVVTYGHVRLAQSTAPSKIIRVALIQDAIPPEFKHDQKRADQNQQRYEDLTTEALRRWPDADLIVWPETMYRKPLLDADPSMPAPPDWPGTQRQYERQLPEWLERQRADMADMVRWFGVPMLLGVDTVYWAPGGPRRYNSAALVAADGTLVGRYDKMHRVLFGEYVPLGEYFPRLQRLTPLPVNLAPGRRPEAFDVGGVRLAPNICYETVLPHVIRRQVLALRVRDDEPDVLVNLTNDGWFRGSSELDMHLVCGAFRAVESRKPLLIAANTGISAWINADGRIVQRGPRGVEGQLLATVGADGRRSLYLMVGD
ncbi:MAG TPA: apolipoprotein N-acyltransferase, partial [Thermoguttaceae bacterium]|nr:apolipoprotein N-acyltransferase [Thermoguttaceae bacterium]